MRYRRTRVKGLLSLIRELIRNITLREAYLREYLRATQKAIDSSEMKTYDMIVKKLTC